MTKGQTKGQKKVVNKESTIYRFLESYINKDNLVIDANIKDFIDILFSDMNKTQKRQKRCNLKKDIKLKKLSPTCRSFILFVNGNIKPNINIQEIIIDKLPALPSVPFIKEKVKEKVKVKVKAEVIVSSEDEDNEEVEEDNIFMTGDDDDGGYIEVNMEKWRERQKIKRSKGYPGMKITPKFTKEELFESIEWITLEKLNQIPNYTLEFVKTGDCYWQGIHEALKLIYNKLEA